MRLLDLVLVRRTHTLGREARTRDMFCVTSEWNKKSEPSFAFIWAASRFRSAGLAFRASSASSSARRNGFADELIVRKENEQ